VCWGLLVVLLILLLRLRLLRLLLLLMLLLLLRLLLLLLRLLLRLLMVLLRLSLLAAVFLPLHSAAVLVGFCAVVSVTEVQLLRRAKCAAEDWTVRISLIERELPVRAAFDAAS
jgi:hypothetical protein